MRHHGVAGALAADRLILWRTPFGCDGVRNVTRLDVLLHTASPLSPCLPGVLGHTQGAGNTLGPQVYPVSPSVPGVPGIPHPGSPGTPGIPVFAGGPRVHPGSPRIRGFNLSSTSKRFMPVSAKYMPIEIL